ncbi:hypothetical protein BD324DRAFT_628622 [Kockovaella imperatae]|uniref:COP9 signalosome complex subunit 3 N-terminal helical repeats domain-containing protein n=1 Tax=Kockovaella imperatae TaxID=4999 RepID=A0A1Y1UE96_9TREE|nr:hypothetical protein BD324DRAFT_628622 [Kockovaella imperatae]ORX36380.1 hypothetical protein BD324DRAFT_628622 [Kockovaella imperatae]
MAAPAHPDLSKIFNNPLGASSSSSSSTNRAQAQNASAISLPKTSTDLLRLMKSTTTNQAVRDTLIPVLNRIADGEGQTGSTKSQKMKKGEMLLQLPNIQKDFDVSKLTDAEIKAMTAALVYVLSARFDNSSAPESDQLMMVWMMKFVKQLDPEQIRMTKSRLGVLAWSFQRLCKRSGKPELCTPIILGIQSFSYPPTVFTGVLPAILESCILVREFDFALPLINEVVRDFVTGAPTYLDVLTYFHHAGLVFAALGDYARATERFVMALCIPTSAASAIQLACAKRAMLCELIVTGKTLRYPKYISSAVTRIIDRNAETYTQLAKAFENHEWAAVQAAGKSPDFKQDANEGLLQAVLASAPKRKILKVRETFSRLRLDQLAIKVEDDSPNGQLTRDTLQAMIQTGEVAASITPSEPSPIITFHEHTIAGPEVTARQLAEAQAADAWLELDLSAGNKSLGLSDTYLGKQLDMHDMSGGGKKSRGAGIEDREAGLRKSGRVRGVGSNMADTGF